MACRRWITRLSLARRDELDATMLPPAAVSFSGSVEADGASTTPFEEAARGSAEESPSETTCPGLRCFRRRRVNDVQSGPPWLCRYWLHHRPGPFPPPHIFSSV